MAINLTDRAAEQVRNYLAVRGGGLGIRLIVQPSECSGMAYRIEFVDKSEDGDVIFDSFGAKVFIDEKSLVWLDETEIDFLQVGDESGFAFSNPNVRSMCGCGESFYV